VVGELKKVTWPSREETTRLTMLVIAISATIGIALGLIDIGFTRVFERFIEGLFPFGTS
jgi:preprotein translocase subunit SecE